MLTIKSTEEKLWFDKVSLSNFIHAGRFPWLVNRYRKRIIITGEVRGELVLGISAGYSLLEEAVDAVRRKKIAFTTIDLEEFELFRSLRNRLGAGEASLIAAAFKRGGVVVTDDRLARNICGEYRLAFTGTIGILLAAVREKRITVDEADDILDLMRAGGFYSPVSRMKDIT